MGRARWGALCLASASLSLLPGCLWLECSYPETQQSARIIEAGGVSFAQAFDRREDGDLQLQLHVSEWQRIRVETTRSYASDLEFVQRCLTVEAVVGPLEGGGGKEAICCGCLVAPACVIADLVGPIVYVPWSLGRACFSPDDVVETTWEEPQHDVERAELAARRPVLRDPQTGATLPDVCSIAPSLPSAADGLFDARRLARRGFRAGRLEVATADGSSAIVVLPDDVVADLKQFADEEAPRLAAARRLAPGDDVAAAVAQAQPGDLIVLAAGDHPLAAPLELPAGVELRGEGANQTRLIGCGDFVVRVAGVASVAGAVAAAEGTPPALLRELAVVHDGEQAGSAVGAFGPFRADRCLFTGGVAADDSPPLAGHGFVAAGDCANVLERCRAEGNARAGFAGIDARGLELNHCAATSNLDGVAWSGEEAGPLDIDGGHFDDNRRHGLHLLAKSGGTVRQATAVGNDGDGLLVAAGRVVIAEVEASDNAKCGVELRDGAVVEADLLTCEQNLAGVRLVADATLSARRLQASSNRAIGLELSERANATIRDSAFRAQPVGVSVKGEASATVRDSQFLDNAKALLHPAGDSPPGWTGNRFANQ